MESNVLTEKEAVEMRGKLEKDDLSVDTARQVLEALLHKSVSMKVLIDSKIGMAVKSTRKHSDAKVAELASSLTSKWKEVVSQAKAGGGVGAAKANDAQRAQVQSDKPGQSVTSEKTGKGAPEPKREQKEKAVIVKPVAREISSASSEGGSGGGGKRAKIKDLLKKAFGESEGVNVDKLATDVEEHLYAHFNGCGEDYTAQFKTIKFNLTDPKNKDFRRMVLSGEILPEDMPKLSTQQMASSKTIELKRKNMEDKIFQDKLFITASNLGAESDMFKCAKCKTSRTTFYQKQTRSADEPMTVFITCRNCGHEWRDGG